MDSSLIKCRCGAVIKRLGKSHHIRTISHIKKIDLINSALLKDIDTIDFKINKYNNYIYDFMNELTNLQNEKQLLLDKKI